MGVNRELDVFGVFVRGDGELYPGNEQVLLAFESRDDNEVVRGERRGGLSIKISVLYRVDFVLSNEWFIVAIESG